MRHFDSIISPLFSILCVSALQGCSFIGLSDFELPQCSTDRECQEAFNEENGYPLECAAFVCDQTGEKAECKNVALEGEIFDAADNDCDGIIDEANDGDAVIVAQSRVITSPPEANAQLTVSVIDGATNYYLSQDKELELLTFPELKAQPIASFAQSALEQPSNIELVEGCYVPNQSTPSQCSSQDFAIAAGDNISFYAAVSTLGCVNGEVRVGVIDPQRPTELIDRGDGFRNPTYRGVNLTPLRCTTAATEACAEAISDYEAEANASTQTGILQNCGGRKPNIAAFGEQALVAYVADRFKRSACANTLTEVQGLGLFLGEGFEGSFYWANPSNDGQVETFGQTRGDASPAVISVNETGFFVAFGNESGEVALSWLPAQESPGSKSPLTCPKVDGAPDCESRSGWETDPLDGLFSLPSLAAENTDEVHLAWLDIDETKGYLAISWTQGCASGDVYAQVLELDLAGKAPEVVNRFDAVKVGTTLGSTGLLSAQERFFSEGASRDEQTLEDYQLGGFYVAYEASEGIVARRLAAADGQLLQDNEKILVAAGSQSIGGVVLNQAAILAKSNANEEFSSWTFTPPVRD